MPFALSLVDREANYSMSDGGASLFSLRMFTYYSADLGYVRPFALTPSNQQLTVLNERRQPFSG